MLSILAGAVVLWRGLSLARQTSVILQWETGTEYETAGYNLYRSTTPEGEFVQINPELIPASGEPMLGGAYQYVDEDVVAGQTYYYQLEEVQLNGAQLRIGRQAIAARRGGSSLLFLAGGLLLSGVLILWWLSQPGNSLSAPSSPTPVE